MNDLITNIHVLEVYKCDDLDMSVILVDMSGSRKPYHNLIGDYLRKYIVRTPYN